MSKLKKPIKAFLIISGFFVIFIFSIFFSLIYFGTAYRYAENLSTQLGEIKYPNSIFVSPHKAGLSIESYLTTGTWMANFCTYTANEIFYSEDDFKKVITFYGDKSIKGKNGKSISLTVSKIELSKPIEEFREDKRYMIDYLYMVSAQDFSDYLSGSQSYFVCL